MTARSLRLRLIVGGVLATLVALTVAGVGLIVLFERHVTCTIGDDLGVYLNQLIAAIDVDARGRLAVTREPADPRFAEPLSGLYWQVADGGGQMLRSRSLWDTALRLQPDSPAPGRAATFALSRTSSALYATNCPAKSWASRSSAERAAGSMSSAWSIAKAACSRCM